MTDLDRLLELHDELQEETGYFPHRFYEKTEKEYESLKAEIEGMIEDGKFVKSWVKEYGQGNKDYLKQMYYDLESQVAKLKETCGLCAEEQIKLKEELEYMTDTNITGARNSAYFAHENGKLQSTLDEIREHLKDVPMMINNEEFVEIVREALAKHEGKGDLATK